MRSIKSIISVILSAALLITSLTLLTIKPAFADEAVIAAGKKLAFARKKGNCLACHVITDGLLAGNIGPPLVMMSARFPDKSILRAQIWDSTVKNPNSIMPPFGRNKILSDDEIDKIVEFVYSL